MADFYSGRECYYRLQHEQLAYHDIPGMLEYLFGKPRKYPSFEAFFLSVLEDNAFQLVESYYYCIPNPRLKIEYAKDLVSPFYKIYIRAPTDENSINILKLHLLIFDIVSGSFLERPPQLPLYDIFTDGTISERKPSADSFSNEEISEQLYRNMELLYSYICECWLIH